jgi:predicted SprT family Zn-dependent metalloprotease
METVAYDTTKDTEVDPTRITYAALVDFYAHFNSRLFESRLPYCLVTLQRRGRYYGYFAGARFGERGSDSVTDEIALNPKYFKNKTVTAILSTLVHEMTHLEQHHFGKPSRGGYHNKAWGSS